MPGSVRFPSNHKSVDSSLDSQVSRNRTISKAVKLERYVLSNERINNFFVITEWSLYKFLYPKTNDGKSIKTDDSSYSKHQRKPLINQKTFNGSEQLEKNTNSSVKKTYHAILSSFSESISLNMNGLCDFNSVDPKENSVTLDRSLSDDSDCENRPFVGDDLRLLIRSTDTNTQNPFSRKNSKPASSRFPKHVEDNEEHVTNSQIVLNQSLEKENVEKNRQSAKSTDSSEEKEQSSPKTSEVHQNSTSSKYKTPPRESGTQVQRYPFSAPKLNDSKQSPFKKNERVNQKGIIPQVKSAQPPHYYDRLRQSYTHKISDTPKPSKNSIESGHSRKNISGNSNRNSSIVRNNNIQTPTKLFPHYGKSLSEKTSSTNATSMSKTSVRQPRLLPQRKPTPKVYTGKNTTRKKYGKNKTPEQRFVATSFPCCKIKDEKESPCSNFDNSISLPYGVSSRQYLRRPKALEYDLHKMFPDMGVLVRTKKKHWDYRNPEIIRALYVESETNLLSDWKARYMKLKLSKGKQIKNNWSSRLKLNYLQYKKFRVNRDTKRIDRLMKGDRGMPDFPSVRTQGTLTSEYRQQFSRNRPPVPQDFLEYFQEHKRLPFKIVQIKKNCRAKGID